MFKKHGTQYIVGAIAAIVTVILSIYIYATISKVEDVGYFMRVPITFATGSKSQQSYG